MQTAVIEAVLTLFRAPICALLREHSPAEDVIRAVSRGVDIRIGKSTASLFPDLPMVAISAYPPLVASMLRRLRESPVQFEHVAPVLRQLRSPVCVDPCQWMCAAADDADCLRVAIGLNPGTPESARLLKHLSIGVPLDEVDVGKRVALRGKICNRYTRPAIVLERAAQDQLERGFALLGTLEVLFDIYPAMYRYPMYAWAAWLGSRAWPCDIVVPLPADDAALDIDGKRAVIAAVKSVILAHGGAMQHRWPRATYRNTSVCVYLRDDGVHCRCAAHLLQMVAAMMRHVRPGVDVVFTADGVLRAGSDPFAYWLLVGMVFSHGVYLQRAWDAVGGGEHRREAWQRAAGFAVARLEGIPTGYERVDAAEQLPPLPSRDSASLYFAEFADQATYYETALLQPVVAGDATH